MNLVFEIRSVSRFYVWFYFQCFCNEISVVNTPCHRLAQCVVVRGVCHGVSVLGEAGAGDTNHFHCFSCRVNFTSKSSPPSRHADNGEMSFDVLVINTDANVQIDMNHRGFPRHVNNDCFLCCGGITE